MQVFMLSVMEIQDFKDLELITDNFFIIHGRCRIGNKNNHTRKLIAAGTKRLIDRIVFVFAIPVGLKFCSYFNDVGLKVDRTIRRPLIPGLD